MLAIITTAIGALGPDLLLVGAIGITVSVGVLALIVGWKVMTKLLL